MQNIDFNLTYSIKDLFFDRIRVQAAIGKAEAKELSHIGAFIRNTARRKVLRSRKRVSMPGEAPSIHSTDRVATLRNILFAYLPTEHAVIVGPVKLNQQNLMAEGFTEPVPSILQFGGTVVIQEQQFKKDKQQRWFRRDLRYSPRPWKRYRTRVANYLPRPYMDVALDIEVKAGTIRDVWKGSVTK